MIFLKESEGNGGIAVKNGCVCDEKNGLYMEVNHEKGSDIWSVD